MTVTKPPMVLTGDSNVPDMPLTDAQVNHLRRLLAWMRCEWTLDKDMQRGYLMGASEMVAHGITTPERASAVVQAKAEQINRVPAYVRQAVKMLTQALRQHEKASGIVDEKRTGQLVAGLARSPSASVHNKPVSGILATCSEFEAYEAALPQMLKEHSGEYVVIQGSQLHRFFGAYEEALSWGYETFGLGPFFVKLVEPPHQRICRA